MYFLVGVLFLTSTVQYLQPQHFLLDVILHMTLLLNTCRYKDRAAWVHFNQLISVLSLDYVSTPVLTSSFLLLLLHLHFCPHILAGGHGESRRPCNSPGAA